MAKWVYMFTEGNADMRNLLGGKGANLAEMTNLGLPVPQGFTVTTEACTSTMRMADRSTTKLWVRSWKLSIKWKASQERNSETSRIRFSFPFVLEQELPCQV